MAIHTFGSTGEAYDACMTRDDIVTGDLLLIPSEGVIGVAATWPVALTEEHGSLHTAHDPIAYLTEMAREAGQ